MKIFLIIVATIILIIAVLGIAAPKEFKLERSIVINKPVAEVFSHLNLLKNHDQWNAWTKKDPNIKKEFKGTDGTVGFTSFWVSEDPEIGTGEQEIKNIVENQKLETEIRLKKPFEASFSSYMTTEPEAASQTKVVMGMYSKIPFPMNVISFIFNVCAGQQQKIIKNMDASLGDLKSLLEKQ
jgi:hypothetical protein